MAKFFKQLALKTYPRPKHYYFCCPHAVGNLLHNMMAAGAATFKANFLAAWKGENTGMQGMAAELTQDVQAAIDDFDFDDFIECPVHDLLAWHALDRTAHHEMFGIVPKRGDDAPMPAQPAKHETVYVDQLLRVYSEDKTSPVTLADLAGSEYEEHFDSHRQLFYCAEGLQRFSATSTPLSMSSSGCSTWFMQASGRRWPRSGTKRAWRASTRPWRRHPPCRFRKAACHPSSGRVTCPAPAITSPMAVGSSGSNDETQAHRRLQFAVRAGRADGVSAEFPAAGRCRPPEARPARLRRRLLGRSGGPPSLHTPVPYRGSEYLSRRDLIAQGLYLMSTRGLVAVSMDECGITYFAGDSARSMVGALTSPYLRELENRCRWAAATFAALSSRDLTD